MLLSVALFTALMRGVWTEIARWISLEQCTERKLCQTKVDVPCIQLAMLSTGEGGRFRALLVQRWFLLEP
jgi:hypothetical protein